MFVENNTSKWKNESCIVLRRKYEENAKKCTKNSFSVHNYYGKDCQNAQKDRKTHIRAMENDLQQYNFKRKNGCILLQNRTG